MTSRSRFTLDEARVAGERIGVDQGSAPFDLGQFRGEAVWRFWSVTMCLPVADPGANDE